MQFNRDLFISYTHIDNATADEDESGWIDILHKGLEVRLPQLRGKPVDIWRDNKKLRGNDVIDESIFAEFPKLALLVSIISPGYMNSKWCQAELKHFLEAVQAQGGLKIPGTNSKRIFKVVKTPLEEYPEPVQDVLGYVFFEKTSSGHINEFNGKKGSPTYFSFFDKLYELAYDIHQALRMLESLQDGATPENSEQAAEPSGGIQLSNDGKDLLTATGKAAAKVIYLAETTPDLARDRDKVRQELMQAGHRVLPEGELPYRPADFEQAVRLGLLESALSVHLVSHYPLTPLADSELTDEEEYRRGQVRRTQRQITLAQTLAKDISPDKPTFSSIFWMPRDSGNLKPDPFVASLENEANFIKSTREELKDIIINRLVALDAPPAIATTRRRIYLDHIEQDVEDEDWANLCDWLDQKFEVILPDEEDRTPTQSEELMNQCEAILIYYSNSTAAWLKRRLGALKKNVFRPASSRPLLTRAVYAVNPHKQLFEPPGIQVIKGFGGFTPDLLEDFVQCLEMGS